MATNNNKPLARVFHFDLYGKRQEKYNFLLENDLHSINWTELQPTAPDYFFVPKDFSLKEEYEKGFSVTELFTVNSSGIKTHDDDNLVSFEPFKENNQTYNYRPFDIRYINYDLKKVVRHRYNVMQHFLKGKNIGLICSRQCVSDWRYVFVTSKMADINLTATAGAFGGGYIFPLYLYQEHFGQTEKVANLNAAIVAKFPPLLWRGAGGEVQIFDYIYAILHSPSYRELYKEFLKIDFPRIPYPENAEQFNKLAAFGEQLRHLHLMETSPNSSKGGESPLSNWRGAGGEVANFPVQGSNEIENSFTGKSNDYRDNKVFINDVQYFDNVPEIAWNFYIGGYQPAQKWLKDRRRGAINRALTYEDIEHYQKIIFVLSETDRIMKEIDGLTLKDTE